MKKMMSVVMIALLSGMSFAALVDDFEGYSAGAVADVTGGVWNTTDTAIVTSDGSNQYLSVSNSVGGYQWTRMPNGLPFSVDGTATLSFDIYIESETAIDCAFGLTDNSTLTWYDQFGPYVRVITNGTAGDGIVALSTRDDSVSGSFVNDVAMLNLNQWYNIALVIDVAGGDQGYGGWDIYLDGSLVYSSADFRKNYASPLTTFAMGVATTTGVRVDNINLVPEPATMMLLGLGGLFAARRKK